MIPCNCVSCKGNQKPYFYKYDVLENYVENRQAEIQCRKKPFEMVNVWGLLYSVLDQSVMR